MKGSICHFTKWQIHPFLSDNIVRNTNIYDFSLLIRSCTPAGRGGGEGAGLGTDIFAWVCEKYSPGGDVAIDQTTDQVMLDCQKLWALTDSWTRGAKTADSGYYWREATNLRSVCERANGTTNGLLSQFSTCSGYRGFVMSENIKKIAKYW